MPEQSIEELGNNAAKVKEFLDYIVTGLLGDATILHKTTASLTPEGDLIISVVADPNHVSKLIGKKGHIANSIRDLVRSKGRMTGNLYCSVQIDAIGGIHNNAKERESSTQKT